MFRQRMFLFLLGATLLVAGCDRDATSPLVAADEPAARWVDGEKMVPISWSFHVWAIGDEDDMVTCFLPEGPPYYGIPFEYMGQVVEVSDIYAVSGTLSHLGLLEEELSTATIHDCTVGLDDQLLPETIYGHTTAELVGPQGDELHLDGTLTNYIFGGYATGDWDIVGGEGRFYGASGYIDTLEHPDGTGSSGDGSGMVSQPQPVKGGRSW